MKFSLPYVLESFYLVFISMSLFYILFTKNYLNIVLLAYANVIGFIFAFIVGFCTGKKRRNFD